MCRTPELVEVCLDPENWLWTLETECLSEYDLNNRRYWEGVPGFCLNHLTAKSPTLTPVFMVHVSLAIAPIDRGEGGLSQHRLKEETANKDTCQRWSRQQGKVS